MLGFLIVLGFMLMVIFAPVLAPYDYAEQDIPSMLQGPSRNYPLGTDHVGRDLLSRIIYGSRIALGVAVPAVSIALTGGVVLGLISGYLGGIVDNVALVLMDSLNAFPSVVLALAILALLGPSLINVIVVIGLAWVPGYARIARAQVLSAKQNVYVEAERSLGATNRRILLAHILPNIIAPLLILAAMDLPVVITFEAGLSFLGLGVRPPTPSWGVILSDGFNFIRQSPWPITWAGLTLIITTLGFTLFGETLRDVLDPRLSGTRGF
jgi:peptide/nickel transport system permease protein